MTSLIFAVQVDFLLSGFVNPITKKPPTNGYVLTYLDGTSTLSALWTDSGKGGTATNPFALDTGGKAEVYGDGVYKFEIYEGDPFAGGTLLETINGLNYKVGQTSNTSYLSQYDSFSDAITAIGSSETTLIIDTPFTLTESVTVHDNLSLKWLNGCLASGTYTLTINGSLEAGTYQLFGSDVTVSIDSDTPVVFQWFGAVGDGTTDDTTAIQAAFDSSTNVIDTLGKTYRISAITIDNDYTWFTGTGKGYGTSFSPLVGQTSGDLITVNANQTNLSHFSITGNSSISEAGSDDDVVGIKYNGNTAGDAGAKLRFVTFRFINWAVQANSRSVEITHCTVAYCHIGFGIEPNVTSTDDCRAYQISDMHFHGVGTGNTTHTYLPGCFIIPAECSIRDVAITDCHGDNCNTFFRGFCGGSQINNINLTRAVGEFGLIDTTDYALLTVDRSITINGISYTQAHPDTSDTMFLSVYGSINPIMKISNILCNGVGNHGISLNVNWVQVSDVVLHNVGQKIDNTYSGIVVNNSAGYCHLRNIVVTQDRTATPTNKAAYAYVLNGTSPRIEGLKADGFVGNEMSVSNTINVYGEEPYRAPRHIKYATAAPATGSWNKGDIIYDSTPTAGSYVGWICVTDGTPGTWKAFGAISA